MDYIKKADRVVNKLIMGGARKFILFPFGECGMKVKSVLNQRYGIQEEYIVDNRLAGVSEDKHIISLEELKSKDIKGMIVLLTSDSDTIYSEIRYQLMQCVDFKQIVDVFSYSMYFDEDVYYDQGFSMNMNPRIAALEAAAREIYFNSVEGAIAECGVYRGFFANYMSRFMPDRKLYLFDTFEGFDSRDITEEEKDSDTVRNNFVDTSVELVLGNIGYRMNSIVRKGYFPDTAEGLKNERFAFVSLDTDLYKPIIAGLDFFWPKLNPGGYIFVHDFINRDLLGVRKAVIEFCKKEGIGYVRLPDSFSTAVLSKPL